MNILIDTVRVYGFRALHNIEVNLAPTTILTGMNNSGKSSFLKALQIALGNKQFISYEDFYISENTPIDRIIVDIRIVPIDSTGIKIKTFDPDWEILFTEDRIITNLEGEQFVPLRTVITFNTITNSYKSNQYIQRDWVPFKNDVNKYWYEINDGIERAFHCDQVQFFFMDAQRDIIEDIKSRNSYLGKMIAKIEYSEADIERIETQIEELNDLTISSSNVLSSIRDSLKELNTTMDTAQECIDITPFTKKLRDLNKGLSIYYTDNQDSFSMEYHGMGTRSWSSILTLKSFINLLSQNTVESSNSFFALLAIEEPEAHLHPNAQKKIFRQIDGITCQKVISTHSPYIAASTNLDQIRNFYKKDKNVACGQIYMNQLGTEDIRKIKRHVINTRGEIFFSKAVVFFEGDTEEQALPIFGEKFFGGNCMELGIDFIGVGGAGNYLPFLRITHSMEIPWFIFSDGEDKIKKDLKKTLETLLGEANIDLSTQNNIIILDNGCNFESSLIYDGYESEIEAALIKLHSQHYINEQIQLLDGTKMGRSKIGMCTTCNQDLYQDTTRNYSGSNGYKSALYDLMTRQKTQFGSVIADVIIENGKEIPPKIIDLFTMLKSKLTI